MKNHRPSIKSPISSSRTSEGAPPNKRKSPRARPINLSHASQSLQKSSRQMIKVTTSRVAPLAIRHRFLEGFAISCIAIAVFLCLSMASYQPAKNTTQLVIYAANNIGGQFGYYTARWLFLQIGVMAYMLPAAFSYIGILSFKNRLLDWKTDLLLGLCQILGLSCIIVSGCGFNASLNFHHGLPYPGGLIGFYIDAYLSKFVGDIGIRLLLSVMFLTGMTLSTGISWVHIAEQLIKWSLITLYQLQNKLLNFIRTLVHPKASPPAKSPPSPKATKTVFKEAPEPYYQTESFSTPLMTPSIEETVSKPTRANVQNIVKASSNKPVKQFTPQKPVSIKVPVVPNYVAPSLDLLELPDTNTQAAYTSEELSILSREVELQLKDFGIQVEVVGAYPGPVVTLFEMKLAPGVKASRITALATDLARSLAVVSIRIVEIIPGKPVVGLELPNRNRAMVRLREILDSSIYSESTSPLTLALGKDIAGEVVVADLAKMPHLLVAGTTGSGKSVGLNTMLLSMLYKATPEQVRLIMIDPKMLELSIYEGIPHLLSPVITDMKKAANALNWCIKEMDRRYKLMSLLGVRNLAGYNQKVEEAITAGKPLLDPMSDVIDPINQTPELLEPLPYIVVLADEFADLIMVVGKKVEELIARLAQKARAAGIHLILATQRPSVDVITGLIKANIPTRMAFQVSSGIDSRTILGQQGAEQLLGHGDMLYMAPGTGIPSRVHGAFVADQEVHNVVEMLKQFGPVDYPITFSDASEDGGESADSNESLEDKDIVYEQAVKLVIETNRPSISNVQRRLKIGYNRAATLLEKMEEDGIVSSMSHNGRREVLASDRD